MYVVSQLIISSALCHWHCADAVFWQYCVCECDTEWQTHWLSLSSVMTHVMTVSVTVTVSLSACVCLSLCVTVSQCLSVTPDQWQRSSGDWVTDWLNSESLTETQCHTEWPGYRQWLTLTLTLWQAQWIVMCRGTDTVSVTVKWCVTDTVSDSDVAVLCHWGWVTDSHTLRAHSSVA